MYNLICENWYNKVTDSQAGYSISILVSRHLHLPEIPVRPDYVVGIRLRNNTNPNFGLLYINITSGAGEVDVYYWEGMGSCT